MINIKNKYKCHMGEYFYMTSFSFCLLFAIINIATKNQFLSLWTLLAIAISGYSFLLLLINYALITKTAIISIQGLEFRKVKYENLKEIIIAKDNFSVTEAKEVIVREKDYEMRFTPDKKEINKIIEKIKENYPEARIIYSNKIIGPLEYLEKK